MLILQTLLTAVLTMKTTTPIYDFFPGQPGYAGTMGRTVLDFREARGDGVAVASAGPFALCCR